MAPHAERVRLQVDLASIEAHYVDVRHPITNRLMCRIDIERGLVEVQDKGRVAIIDLAQLKERMG